MNALFCTAEPGALTLKCVAAADVIAIVFDVPVMEEVTVSVAVIVWFPAVFSVTENVPTPLVNGESAGNVAKPSVLVK